MNSIIEKLFQNPVFRLAMISYIIYRGNKDPQLAVMIAAAFLITMHMINKQKIENFAHGATHYSGGSNKKHDDNCGLLVPALNNVGVACVITPVDKMSQVLSL